MRKKLKGTVIGDKNDKTRVVEIKKVYKHPKYGKVLNRSRKLHCHDQKNVSSAGDVVTVMETRPMSKLKKWTVIGVSKPASAGGKE